MVELGTPAEMLDLSGRVVVVTGAGGGVGKGIARRMLAAGAQVVAHTRFSPLEQPRPGDIMAQVEADLTDPDAPGRVVEAALDFFGRIDGLVNNAGVQPVKPFEDLTEQDWSEMIETNLTAVHRLTQVVAEAMIGSGNGGSIVHISSIEGHNPSPGHGHYGVSKAALIMHARAAATAYGSHRIRVNTVSPGLIHRPGLETDWPEGVARWEKACWLGRVGTPEDVGDACVFLCSDLSRWITGAELVVDGGTSTGPTW